MLTEHDIDVLEKDKRLGSPVLSLYVNTDRGTTDGESYLAVLRHLLKIADTQLKRRFGTDGLAAAAILQERVAPRLVEFIEAEVAAGSTIRSIAVFTSLAPARDPHHPILTYTLPRGIRSQVHIDPRPYVRPLLFLLDQYERYAVIVADRKHARFFTMYLGEIEKLTEFTSDTPTRHDQGGWSQKRFQRHVDDHVAHHVRGVVEHAVKMLRHLPTHRLILGGDGDILHLIRDNLPLELQQRVVGTFPLHVHASLHEIRERTLALAADAERAEEEQRVAALRDALAHRGRAVHGLAGTLDVLTQRRVQTLLVKKGFHARGAVCENCGALLPSPGPCPHCQAQAKTVDDVVDHALEAAHRDEVVIEFVTENLDLEALGNIGGILRF